jgi:membrane protein implicated in regulation of membrane protease activity
MMEWLNTLEQHYLWLALGVFLCAAEILVPGMFLIFLGLAALITGLTVWAVPLAVPFQIVLFVGLAFLAVFVGRNFIRQNPVEAADPKMNKRGDRMAGETATVVEALSDGTGRVKHGDSEWLARGPDAAKGAKVRINGSDGAVLIVEPLD